MHNCPTELNKNNMVSKFHRGSFICVLNSPPDIPCITSLATVWATQANQHVYNSGFQTEW